MSRLDSHEYMGRKIKVEYKKVLPPEEAARKEAERRASIAALNDRVMEFDLNDPATRQLYDKMVAFRDDKLRNELIFAKSITGPERKLVRAIGQKLGFFYRTEDNGEERFFKVTRRPSVSVNKVNLKEMELDRMPRKYSLTLAVAAINVFNIVNLGPPNGTLSTPLFGKSQSLASGPFGSPVAGNRFIVAQANFAF